MNNVPFTEDNPLSRDCDSPVPVPLNAVPPIFQLCSKDPSVSSKSLSVPLVYDRFKASSSFYKRLNINV